MDPRKIFVKRHLENSQLRILELGPLNRPIVEKNEYPNCRYCDIRSTEEVKALYSGNAYLETTGIQVDTSTIVEIDDVISGSYSKFYEDKEKFDVVVASHVLEHMDDLIFSLRDIAGILKPGGVFCIVYPDKRYCFDHFRDSASFRDAYNVFRYGKQYNAPMVLDFYLSAVAENSPYRFWENNDLTSILPRNNVQEAVHRFEEARNGIRMDDVHYWPFTDWDFLLFLYECTQAGLLPFRCVDFTPTPENDQQFFLALRLDLSVLQNPNEALENLQKWMKHTLPHFYSSKEKRNSELIPRQKDEITCLHGELEKHKALLNDAVAAANETKQRLAELQGRLVECDMESSMLQDRLTEQNRKTAEQAVELRRCTEELKVRLNRISELETIENSTIWKVSAPLRHFLDLFKK